MELALCNFPRLLSKLARSDVLGIDDFVMSPMAELERRDFLDICEDRYQLCSTVLTWQLPTTRWHDHIGDPTIADSILDRRCITRTALNSAVTRYASSAGAKFWPQGRTVHETLIPSQVP